MKKGMSNRRRFLGRLTKIAGGIGAMMTGLVPELQAQTRPLAATSIATTTLAEAPTLPSTTENSLYSRALGDSDVALLLTSLSELGRLDPPNRSHDIVLDAGNRAQSITMPVVSYATGATIAYIFYGSGSSTASDGSTSTMPLRGIVTDTGRVLVCGGGLVADHPKPEFNDVYFAALFPDRYIATRLEAPQSTFLQRRTSGGVWDSRFLRKVRRAINDKRGMCMEQCDLTWRQCMNTPIVSGSTGLVVGFWCGICLAASGGLIVITVGVAAPTLAACATPCAIAIAALTAAALVAANCKGTWNQCQNMCLNIPAGQPI